MNNLGKIKYTYDVELIVLKDFNGSLSVVNSDGYKNFMKIESDKVLKKKYDLDVNIRDLQPLEMHIKDKRKEEIDNFYIINDFILNFSQRISRRVTRKEIVYKKDKERSIISIQICKRNYLKVFTLKSIEQFDVNKVFSTISKKNCKPLEKIVKIRNNDDIKYLKKILKRYLKEII